MNAGTRQFCSLISLFLVAALLSIWLAGCASTPKIDWAARVGNYTHDDAVKEMGPPEHSAKLTDGTVVADWLTSRGSSRGYVSSSFGYGGYYPGPVFQTYSSPALPDYYLRLTFGPDGKLTEWKKVVK